MKRILVTGGAGFIGSHFVDYVTERYDDQVVVIDKLTYAGDMANLSDSLGRITFVKGDIGCREDLETAFDGGIDWVVNFAAETHVDNSIEAPIRFAETNVVATLRLLMFAVEKGVKRFLQVSTDEVYGSRERGLFAETDAHLPSSPYAATKCAAEKLVWAYMITYGLPIVVTRSSNNYGPRQHPEKFIPKCITNALAGEPVPIYGDGMNERDWLFVRDNCQAIDLVLRAGTVGEAYNIASQFGMPNIELARLILQIAGAPESLLTMVEDRRGHDRRYAMTTDKIEALGWAPATSFEDGLRETIRWYRQK